MEQTNAKLKKEKHNEINLIFSLFSKVSYFLKNINNINIYNKGKLKSKLNIDIFI